MIKAIAFDLDDTLLDTTGLLVPTASVESFRILIQAGLKLTLDECEAKRLEWIKKISHRDVFEKLANEYGDESTRKVVPQAIQVFYEPNIPSTLPLLPGAKENLEYLKKKYKLYLVTAGFENAQINKAKALRVFGFFEKMFVVNSLIHQRKKNIFLQIIEENKIKPSELLCIGNSLSSEIHDALQIGATACYFEFGEDRGTLADKLTMKPQFHIKSHHELIAQCQL